MHSGGNRIYGLHVIIHNRLFAECGVLDNFQGLYGQGHRTRTRTKVQGQRQSLVNWSSRILWVKDFPQVNNILSTYAILYIA